MSTRKHRQRHVQPSPVRAYSSLEAAFLAGEPLGDFDAEGVGCQVSGVSRMPDDLPAIDLDAIAYCRPMPGGTRPAPVRDYAVIGIGVYCVVITLVATLAVVRWLTNG
jgi:hypothetical protein